MKEYPIRQSETEPPRRQFTDNQHFDLIVWYQDPEFKKIAGFQLGFKDNPFNTDKEYFISHFPNMTATPKVRLGETSGIEQTYPAPKMIRKTENPPPESFFRKIEDVLTSVPVEIAEYLKLNLKLVNSSRNR